MRELSPGALEGFVIRAHVSAAGAKGGRMAKPSGAPGRHLRPRCARSLKTDLDGYPIESFNI